MTHRLVQSCFPNPETFPPAPNTSCRFDSDLNGGAAGGPPPCPGPAASGCKHPFSPIINGEPFRRPFRRQPRGRLIGDHRRRRGESGRFGVFRPLSVHPEPIDGEPLVPPPSPRTPHYRNVPSHQTLNSRCPGRRGASLNKQSLFIPTNNSVMKY